MVQSHVVAMMGKWPIIHPWMSLGTFHGSVLSKMWFVVLIGHVEVDRACMDVVLVLQPDKTFHKF